MHLSCPGAILMICAVVFTSCTQRDAAGLKQEIAELRAEVDFLRGKLGDASGGAGLSRNEDADIVADSLARLRSGPAGSGEAPSDIPLQALKLDIRTLARRIDSLNRQNDKALASGVGVADMAKIKRLVEKEIYAQRMHQQGAVAAGAALPEHEWAGTKLRFRQADGSWGKLVDLKGEPGAGGQYTANAVSGASGGATLGDWKIFNINPAQTLAMSREKQATAGIVIGTIHAGRNGRGVLCGETESVKVKASVHWKDFGSNSNLFITDDSFMFPVKPHSGWSIAASQWEGSVSATAYWISLH